MLRKITLLSISAVAALALGGPSAAAGATRDWRSVAHGGNIEVQVDGVTRTLSLTETDLLTPEARDSLARHGHDISGISTLEGFVVGVPGSIVRATVSDKHVIGSINMDGRSYDLASDGSDTHMRRPPITNLVFDVEPVELHYDCSAWVPPHVANPAGPLSGWGPRITFDLAIVTDQTYRNQWSKGDGDWLNDVLATVNSADAIYDQLNMDINVVDIHGDTFTNSDSSVLLDDIKFHYRAYHPTMQRDAVALLVYKEIGPLGQASCISGAGLDDRANLVMTTNTAPFNLLGLQFYSNIYGKTLAHEMGHLLSAHHHYSNCNQASGSPATDQCTLMTPYLDFLDEKIGSFEGLVIRGWAESHM